MQVQPPYKQFPGTSGLCTHPAALPACSSKILTQEKQHFAELAVDAIMRLKGSGNLESIHIIKKPGGTQTSRQTVLYPGAAGRETAVHNFSKRPNTSVEAVMKPSSLAAYACSSFS